MDTRRLKAGQTIYIVDRKMNYCTYTRDGIYEITKYILVEKDPYRLGQCWDFRFPMKHLKWLSEYPLFFYTSRRKAERKLKELLHYM